MVIIWMLIPFYDLFYLEVPSHAHKSKANHPSSWFNLQEKE